MTHILKWAWQRLTRGWDDRIIWSIDSYLAEMMPIWLRKLKADKQGVPSSFFSDFTHIETSAEMAEAQAKWFAVLDEIIAGFEAANRLVNWAAFDNVDADNDLVDRALVLLRQYFFDLWD